MSLCDQCETAAHCLKNGCIPIVEAPKGAKTVVYSKHITVPHNGRHRIIDLEIVFEDDVCVGVNVL